jgi:NADH dehydrogenase
VEVIKGVRVAAYDGLVVRLNNGTSIPAGTLLWTAGVKPSPVVELLPCQKVKGRLQVNEFLAVPGVPGLWAAGDSAAVPDRKTGKFFPPTAQHGLREGRAVAKNIEAVILGRPLKPFLFTTEGQLATIGRRTGVAMVFGLKFSGFAAWCFWRAVYWMKLPGLVKKLRVMVGWTLNIFFGAEIEQMLTLRDVEAIAQKAEQIRTLSERRKAA